MMMKHSKIYLSFLILFTLVSCNGEKTVAITKDYVINPNWDKTANSFQIFRMNLKDSSDNIELKSVSPGGLLGKLTKDTSFAYTANVKYNGVKYSKRKVYFERYNDFVWRKPPDIEPDRSSEYETIGKLQQKTWYLFAGLSDVKTLYYVYIDSLGYLHSFKVPASSWTNY